MNYMLKRCVSWRRRTSIELWERYSVGENGAIAGAAISSSKTRERRHLDAAAGADVLKFFGLCHLITGSSS